MPIIHEQIRRDTWDRTPSIPCLAIMSTYANKPPFPISDVYPQYHHFAKTDPLAPLVALLLPHLDALDHHLAVVLPRRLPRLPAVPEIFLGRGRLIDPRLAGSPILEPTIGTTDGNVEDEVEFLIERRGEVAGLAPRVDQASAVAIGKREIAAGPERLVEVGVEDLEETSVDVSEEILLAPLHAEGVEGLGEGRVQSVALHVGTPPGIVGGVWSPV